MKKRIFKNITAVLMAGIMLIIAMGCGKLEADKKETGNVVYEGEKLDAGDIEGEIETFFVNGDRI